MSVHETDTAIKYSCNPYFTYAFYSILGHHGLKNESERIRNGLTSWSDLVKQFGFGSKLGIDLPEEKSGFVPDVSFYDKVIIKVKLLYYKAA